MYGSLSFFSMKLVDRTGASGFSSATSGNLNSNSEIVFEFYSFVGVFGMSLSPDVKDDYDLGILMVHSCTTPR